MEASTNKVVDECHELKNIKYKTMLLNGVSLMETKSSDNISNLDKFLETEKNNNNIEPWCKLNKTMKTKKLCDFVQTYGTQNNLGEEETNAMILFLKDSLDKKKLSRVKDVIYDKGTGIIKDIPALVYTKSNKHFTLKNIDKRVSTLKSLAPKKPNNATIRHKEIKETTNHDSESEEE
jgi:hypothetical protein